MIEWGEIPISPPAVVDRRTPEELEQLARYAAIDLAGASAQEIIRWSADVFGKRVVLSQSMANTALAHLINSVAPEIEIVFLDTGVHFPETLQTRDRLISTTSLKVINAIPPITVAEQAAMYGEELWKTNPDLCCQIRKVKPMEDLLRNYDAWINGMRHASALHRKGRKVVEYDEERQVIKIAPMLHWSDQQLLRYTLENDVVMNPLMYDGYPSIGCAPCTKRVAVGEDPRAGRWSGTGKTECGLHT